MSEFSESFHIRTAAPKEALKALRKAKIGGVVFPARNGWLSFVPFADTPLLLDPTSQAQKILEATAMPVLHYRFAEDHGWSFELHRPNEPPVAYECVWDSENTENRTRFDAGALSEIMDGAVTGTAIEAVLAGPEHFEDAYRFAELLKLPAYQWLSPESAVTEQDESHPHKIVELPLPEQVSTPAPSVEPSRTRDGPYRCHACGYTHFKQEPYVHKTRQYSGETCPCCGYIASEPKKDEQHPASIRRREWVLAGMPWHDPNVTPPKGWDARVQLRKSHHSIHCPVCGYDGLLLNPRSMETNKGSGETCPACGFTFGISDDVESFSYNGWRQQWLARGAPWHDASVDQPGGWDPPARERKRTRYDLTPLIPVFLGRDGRETMLVEAGIDSFVPALKLQESLARSEEELREYRGLIGIMHGPWCLQDEAWLRDLDRRRALNHQRRKETGRAGVGDFGFHLDQMRPADLRPMESQCRNEMADSRDAEIARFGVPGLVAVAGRGGRTPSRRRLYEKLVDAALESDGFENKGARMGALIHSRPLSSDHRLDMILDTHELNRKIDPHIAPFRTTGEIVAPQGPSVSICFAICSNGDQQQPPIERFALSSLFPIEFGQIGQKWCRDWYGGFRDLTELAALIEIHLTMWRLIRNELYAALRHCIDRETGRPLMD